MPTKKTVIELLSDVASNVLTGGRRTIAENVRKIMGDQVESAVNKKDGGMVVDQQLGYSTDITVTDDRAFVSKKQAEEIASQNIPYGFDTLPERVTQLESDVDGIEVDITNIVNEIDTINDELALLEGDLYGLEQDVDSLQLQIQNKQDKAIVVSSNTTAVNDAVYHNVANTIYTDPSPVEGKGFKVFVRNGTATVGGTAYATAGTIIKRTFHSGSWSNDVFTPLSFNDSRYTQINSDASLTSLTLTGTGGNGFLSLNLQSSNPSAVNNTMRLFMDSSGRFSWVRRNNANSADIKRTLIMPDQNIDYTFPTPASGTASTLAGLNTAQTFSSQQTFTGNIDCNGTLQVLRIVARSATAGPDIGSASNTNSLIRIGGVISGTTYSNEYSQAGSSTNGLTLETSTQTGATGLVGALIIRSGGVNNASNSNVGANIQMYTREILAGTGASGSILLDVGLTTAGANGAGTKAGIALFNRMTTPNWQSGQRILFIGNRDAAPTGNPSGGGFLYVEAGALIYRGSSGTVTTIANA